jgi:hypothetical protein
VKCKGCRDSTDQRTPLLPVKEIALLLPPDAEIEEIDVIPKVVKLSGEYRLCSPAEPVPIGTESMIIDKFGNLIQMPDEFLEMRDPEIEERWPAELVFFNPIQKLSGHLLTQ